MLMFYRKLTDFFHESIVSAPAHAGEKGEVAKNQHKAHSHGAPSPAMKSHCFVCKTLNTVLESTYIGSFSSDFPQSNEIQFLMFHSGIGAFFKKGTPYWQVNCVSGLTYRSVWRRKHQMIFYLLLKANSYYIFKKCTRRLSIEKCANIPHQK